MYFHYNHLFTHPDKYLQLTNLNTQACEQLNRAMNTYKRMVRQRHSHCIFVIISRVWYLMWYLPLLWIQPGEAKEWAIFPLLHAEMLGFTKCNNRKKWSNSLRYSVSKHQSIWYWLCQKEKNSTKLPWNLPKIMSLPLLSQFHLAIPFRIQSARLLHI
jgi:hypothetical protein